MKTVHEVSELSGVSIRTLQYYDRIGLLSPTDRTEAGYRLYDGAALSRVELSGRHSGIIRTAVRNYSDDTLVLSGFNSDIIRTAL